MAINIDKNPAPETIPTTPPDHEWDFLVFGEVSVHADVRHDPTSATAVFVTLTIRGLPAEVQARAPTQTHRFDEPEGGHGDAEVYAQESIVQLVDVMRMVALAKVLGVPIPGRDDAPTTDIFGTAPRGES